MNNGFAKPRKSVYRNIDNINEKYKVNYKLYKNINRNDCTLDYYIYNKHYVNYIIINDILNEEIDVYKLKYVIYDN